MNSNRYKYLYLMVEIKDNDDSARQKDLISHKKKYIPIIYII